jgi:hypothetical protein
MSIQNDKKYKYNFDKKKIIKLIFFGFVLGDLKLYSTENKLNCQSLEC